MLACAATAPGRGNGGNSARRQVSEQLQVGVPDVVSAPPGARAGRRCRAIGTAARRGRGACDGGREDLVDHRHRRDAGGHPHRTAARRASERVELEHLHHSRRVNRITHGIEDFRSNTALFQHPACVFDLSQGDSTVGRTLPSIADLAERVAALEARFGDDSTELDGDLRAARRRRSILALQLTNIADRRDLR